MLILSTTELDSFKLACIGADLDTVVALLSKKDTITSSTNQDAEQTRLSISACLPRCVEINKLPLLKTLVLNKKIVFEQKDIDAAFIQAVNAGLYSYFEVLINHPQVNPAAMNNAALRCAIDKNYDAIIERLLSIDTVLKAELPVSTLVWAVRVKKLELVKHLLSVYTKSQLNTIVTPLIETAIKKIPSDSHKEIVETLFKDERIDYKGHTDIILRWAIASYNMFMLKYLIEVRHFNPIHSENILCCAIESHKPEYLYYLLQVSKNYSAGQLEAALSLAITESGLPRILSLLQMPNMPPLGEASFKALISGWGYINERMIILTTLVHANKSDVTYNQQALLNWAIKTNELEVIPLLLKLNRFNLNLKDAEVVSIAAKHNNKNLAFYFLDHDDVTTVSSTAGAQMAADSGHLGLFCSMLRHSKVNPSKLVFPIFPNQAVDKDNLTDKEGFNSNLALQDIKMAIEGHKSNASAVLVLHNFYQLALLASGLGIEFFEDEYGDACSQSSGLPSDLEDDKNKTTTSAASSAATLNSKMPELKAVSPVFIVSMPGLTKKDNIKQPENEKEVGFNRLKN